MAGAAGPAAAAIVVLLLRGSAGSDPAGHEQLQRKQANADIGEDDRE